jgi:hypothetical protein
LPTRSNKRKVTDAAKEVAAFIGEHKAEVALRATKSATAAAKAKAKAAAKAETVAKKADAVAKKAETVAKKAETVAKAALPATKAKAEKVASDSSVKKTFTLADETSRSQFRARIQDGPSFSMKYTVASKEDIRKKINAAELKACGD